MPRKPAGKKYVRTSITLPPEIMAALRKRLQAGESMSALIGRAVAAYFKK